MPEKAVYNGVWWLSDNPNETLSGQLTLSSINEATLELWGSLSGVDISADYSTPLILGISNEKITLQGCLLVNTTESHRMSFSGLPSYLFRISIVFIGGHFNTEEEIRFRRLSIRYTNMDEWVIEPGRIESRYIRRSRRFEIQCKKPRSIKAHVAGYYLTIGAKLQTEQDHTQGSVTLEAWILASSRQKRSLNDYFNYLYHIQNFLSLVIGEPTYPLEIWGEVKVSKEVQNRIQIRCSLAEWVTETKDIHWFSMPLLLKDIQGNLGRYLSNWISKSEMLKPVYDLLFGIMYNPHLYISMQFLILTQALEAYYRRCGHYNGKYQPDNEYRQGTHESLKSAVEPIIPDSNFRDSIMQTLEYANQYSLRKMLRQLAETVKELIEPYKPGSAEILEALEFTESIKEIKKFVNFVVGKRNGLTHYNPKSESGKKNSSSKDENRENIEFLHLVHRLAFILEICLLREIGILDELFGVELTEEQLMENQSDLDNRNISEDLRQEFESHEISLSQDAAVSTEENIGWLITDNGRKYHIRQEENKLNIYDVNVIAKAIETMIKHQYYYMLRGYYDQTSE